MYVLSQSNSSVVKADAIAIDARHLKDGADLSDGVWIWGTQADNQFLLGKYATIERAHEVIMQATDSINNGAKIYVMPNK